ncbi:hypothetical protein [Streptomyces sp. H39-S7]|uniref:hypothetical protein n=1 Tax=Streptomyces sp. H39-S7 TaxID=3004357 RepID=UPI0022B04081|nr:hypothetical protein [Streptomyces sp. H39-S7]MCZ4120266.1 hypothetical protein [Streptomyces sp. H39-S7]
MSKEQRGRRHRQPQQRPARPASRVPAPVARRDWQSDPRYAGSSPLRGRPGAVATLLERLSGDQLVELLMPHLWASIVEGIPSNTCVDACHTLRYAYGQFGLRSELQPVSLMVRNGQGETVVDTAEEPWWSADGSIFHGHCVLGLPDCLRVVDPTVEQFAPVRELGQGPLVGRTIAAEPPAQAGRLMAPGTLFAVQRGDCRLLYTVAADRYTDVVRDQEWITAHAPAYYRTGVNLASMMILALRIPDVIGRARQTPYPRLHALLRVIGDAQEEIDDARDLRFRIMVDGVIQALRLDEIPLPATTPAPGVPNPA